MLINTPIQNLEFWSFYLAYFTKQTYLSRESMQVNINITMLKMIELPRLNNMEFVLVFSYSVQSFWEHSM